MPTVIPSVALQHLICTWREGRTPVLCLLACLFAGTALWQSYSASLGEDRLRLAEARREERDWQNRRAGNPHGAAHFGRYVIRPLPPLYFFEPGVMPYQGAAIRVLAHQQDPARDPQGLPGDFLGSFGGNSPALCLQLLFPLLIVFLSFDSVAGERDSGLLKLMASQGVNWRQLAAGKLAAISLQWLAPFSLVAGSVWLLSPAGARNLSLYLTLLTAYLVYLMVHAVVCLVISLGAGTSRSALTLCLAWWVVSCLVVPRLAAETIHAGTALPPAPAFFAEIHDALNQTTDGHDSGARQLLAVKERLLREHGVSRVEDLPVNFDGVALEVSERLTSAVYRQSYERYWQSVQQQEERAVAFAPISPFLAVRSISQSIAGTGIAAQVDFERQAADYGVAFVQTMNRAVTTLGKVGDWSLRVDKQFWAATPTFQFKPQDAATRLNASLRPLFTLLAALALAVLPLLYLTRPSRSFGA